MSEKLGYGVNIGSSHGMPTGRRSSLRPYPISLALWLVLAVLPAQAEWQIAAYLGGAHTQSSDVTARLPSLDTDARFRRVGYIGNSFEPPLYYGIRGGNFFGRHVGVEAEFIHLKVLADIHQPVPAEGTFAGTVLQGPVPLSNFVQRFSISHGVNLLLGNLALRQSWWESGAEKLGRVLVNVRVGFGGTFPHPEIQVNGMLREQYQVGRPVFQAAGGAELRLWRKAYWLAEYKYTYTNQRISFPRLSGSIETLLQSHHLVTGVALHF